VTIPKENEYEAKLKEFEEGMNTYRYLADMNVKYFMFFLIVNSFVLKIFVDEDKPIYALVLFVIIIGIYGVFSIGLIHQRMSGLNKRINELCAYLKLEAQDFTPFLAFLKLTIAVVFLVTITVGIGMCTYHPAVS